MANIKKHAFRISARHFWVVTLITLLLNACGSIGPMPDMKESFHTEIAQNGAKRFTFTLKREYRNIPAPVGVDNRQKDMRRSAIGLDSGANRRIKAYFDQTLEKTLVETGFCEQGYFEIERTVSEYGGEVRGECREGAF